MTSEQIALVRSSFAAVRPIADVAASLFYARLFELDSALEHLFHGDMRDQGRKLMGMLAFVVGNLDRPDKLLPAVSALAERHHGYGVQSSHYETVGMALLWTLEHGLGEAFTDEVRDAWATAYQALSEIMLAAEPVPA